MSSGREPLIGCTCALAERLGNDRFLYASPAPRAFVPVHDPPGHDVSRRLVHGGGRSAHATNRPTDAVGKSVDASKLMTALASLQDPQPTHC